MKRALMVLSSLALLVSSGCTSVPRPGSNSMAYDDGTKYEGELVGGAPDGKGTMTFPEGGRYSGEFKKGRMDGTGVYHYADGVSKYEGDFKDGKRHGLGVFTRPFSHKTTKTVVIYTGTFVNDKGEGPAVQEAKGMFTIRANCRDSLAFGPGTRTYVNGDTYVGEFRNNHHYDGKYTWANGDTYEGTFDGYHPHGKNVKKTYADGTVYEGDIFRGVMQGNGVLTFADGTRYEGTFEKDKMHGAGSMTFPDGSSYEGEFKDDEIRGKGVFTAKDGTRTSKTF